MVSATLAVPFYLLTSLSTSYAVLVTTLTSNFDGDICPGEQLVLTCYGQGTSQRWIVMTEGGLTLVEHTFTRSDWQTQVINKAEYNFTLVSTTYDNFESTLSTISSSTLRNAQVECVTSGSSSNRITLRIIGVPSLPQMPNITVVGYHCNYSTLLLTWKQPMKNESYNVIDYYQYQLSHDHFSRELSGRVLSSSDTTNTSALVTGVPNNENLTLSVTAHNCAGKSSTVTANISISGPVPRLIGVLTPTRLQTVVINSNTLLLLWHAPDGENTNGILQQSYYGYHVEVTDIISTNQTTYTTNETHLLVDNLQPNHKYTFRVAALTNFNVRGPFSKAITVTLPDEGIHEHGTLSTLCTCMSTLPVYLASVLGLAMVCLVLMVAMVILSYWLYKQHKKITSSQPPQEPVYEKINENISQNKTESVSKSENHPSAEATIVKQQHALKTPPLEYLPQVTTAVTVTGICIYKKGEKGHRSKSDAGI